MALAFSVLSKDYIEFMIFKLSVNFNANFTEFDIVTTQVLFINFLWAINQNKMLSNRIVKQINYILLFVFFIENEKRIPI
jgi:hypothetical protein